MRVVKLIAINVSSTTPRCVPNHGSADNFTCQWCLIIINAVPVGNLEKKAVKENCRGSIRSEFHYS